MQPFVYRGAEVAVLPPDATADGLAVLAVDGPVWEGGHRSEFVNLERAWIDALREAARQGDRHVAVPAPPTVAGGFPVPQAARVGLNSVYRYLREEPGTLDRVVVVADAATYEEWAAAQHEVTETMLG